MAEVIRMPKLSDTMTEGVVAKWHKKVGDKVNEGDLLADIETDKATMEFESYEDGILLYVGVKEGEAAPVDSVLAIFGKKGEDFSSLLNDEPKIKTEKETNTKKQEITADVDISNIKANIIKMPKLSDTMTEGVLSKWHKNIGDKIASGDLLADIETDKATMEFESYEDGILLHQGMKEGESAPVDAVLAIIGEKNADFKTLLKAKEQDIIKRTEVSEPKEVTKTPSPKITTNNNNNARIKVSPLAKKLASEKNINLSLIIGSGTDGRIIKQDIENYNATASVSNFVSVEKYTEIPVSQMRKTIAKRLGESKFTAPHFYLTIDIVMDNMINARKSINEIAPTKISFNDLIIKATAAAIKENPKVNSSWLGNKIRYNEHINIGVAVAVEEGLLVPVVRFADSKKLSTISAEVKDFAKKANEKKLQPADWEGSTFTISNLGMFGIEEFTAIINPPDACILAVGATKQVPIVKNGQLAVGNVMRVTLSCDHRVVDGVTGSKFLNSFKIFMENPIILLGSKNI